MITNTTKPKRRRGGKPSEEDASPAEAPDKPPEEDAGMIMDMLNAAPKPIHMTGIYGDVNETKAQEAVFSLLLFQKDIMQDTSEEPPGPIEF